MRTCAAPPPCRRQLSFGPNPGGLHAWQYVPRAAGPLCPLVVVLHGCAQTATGYDSGSGWSALAERFGFAVLFAEQRRGNNPNLLQLVLAHRYAPLG